MNLLSPLSDRIIVRGNYVGLDDRFWYVIVKHKKIFRKATYSIEQVYAWVDTPSFQNKGDAIEFAKRCICDIHDLIKREANE
jgi:hypothetical protein